jgi:hypothetical protein
MFCRLFRRGLSGHPGRFTVGNGIGHQPQVCFQ